MSNIKAILFDLDNTLIDFMKMKEISCKKAVEAMIDAGLKMSFDEAYPKLMEAYFELGLESDKAFTEFLERNGQFNHKILAAAINAYLQIKTTLVKPYPNTKEVLDKLSEKKIVLGVLTDAPKTKAYQRLLLMNIEPYFKFVVAYEDTQNGKNTGLPLLLALRLLQKEERNIANNEILMVGDSIERDIIPAKKLGLQTALSDYDKKNSQTENIDYLLTDIKDLLTII